MIFETPGTALLSAYPGSPARLRHRLGGDALFSLPALIALARRRPATSIEYNAGDLPIDQNPDETPMTGLSAEETIRRIAECGSWMVLKGVEEDEDYGALLGACLADITPIAVRAGGAMQKRIGFIFVSSPGAVTPLHFDPEHNILMQISGEKCIHIYPADRGIAPAEHQERYHAGEAHRNLRHNASTDAYAQAVTLAPGDAVYVPPKAPHWVKNGSAPSISFSITWRSRATDNDARLRLANHALRKRGASPAEPGAAPLRDGAKIVAQRLVSRLRRRKPG